MAAAFAGALFAAGLLILLQGLFPKRETLADRIALFDTESISLDSTASESLLDSYALRLLETVKGDKLERFESDLLVSGSDLQTSSIEKLKGGAATGGGLAALAILLEWVSDPLGLLMVVLVGSALGYSFPDFELKKKAAARRVEFSQTLTAFMTLLNSSISGGGGITTALDDASAMGDGWVFAHIRDSLAAARLDGTSAWVALERLGQKLQVVPLIELAGALTLAGASGARVTETLVARAQSSREKELAEVRAEAEAKSSKLGLPVGMIMMTWVFFIMYPAVQNFLAL